MRRKGVRNPAGTQTTLATAQSRGVWFGNGYSHAANWSLGSPTAGNYLSLTAKFSAGAADWSAYVSDTSYGAFFAFAPTGLPTTATRSPRTAASATTTAMEATAARRPSSRSTSPSSTPTSGW